MTITFQDSDHVPFDRRQLSLEAYEDVYVVGDVHGCLGALERLLEKLELGANDLAIFVGDLVRKGPASKAVLDRIRSSPRLLSVRGNNEQKLLDGDASISALEHADREYLASLPVAISWDGGFVVHGGVDPTRALADHSPDELLTMRAPDGDGYDGPFWFDEYAGPPRVFFGHTVLEAPYDGNWAVGLDTGCVYGGRLTAFDVRREEFIAVPADGYVPRSDEKIAAVEPQ